jgi:hypothetical protein
VKKLVCLAFLVSCLFPLTAFAKPKEKIYKNAPADVFQAALRCAREEHVVTYVDEKNLMLTFETGVSALSYGFVANASVEPLPDGSSKLLINVQHKNDGKNASYSFGAGDRMANKFFEKVDQGLAQAAPQIPAAPARAQVEPAPEARAPASPQSAQNATVTVNSTPDGGDITVDGGFVGNTPSTLKLAPGKHTIAVAASGYQGWSRDLTVISGSELRLNATLEKK